MVYAFEYNGRSYNLEAKACEGFFNDEEYPIQGAGVETVLEALLGSDRAYFEMVYYDLACDSCHANRREDSKVFGYLESHFYLFAKNGKYVMNSLDPSYREQSFNKLEKEGLVNQSYLVSINVCPSCGAYAMDLENGPF